MGTTRAKDRSLQSELPVSAPARPEPLTRALALRWAPCPRLYDSRSRVLEVVEAVCPVKAWNIDEGRVAVSVEADSEIAVSVTGLTVTATNLGGDSVDVFSEVALSLAEGLGDLLSYEVLEARTWFQYLLPWTEGDELPAVAFASATRRLFPQFADQLGLTDFALLSDGRSTSGRDFQFETGVVQGEEAPLRLARILGRIEGHDVATPATHRRLFHHEYPDLATFVDASWVCATPPTDLGALPRWLAQQVIETESESTALALELHALSTGTPKEGEA